jgi:hypothetical protein
MTNPFAHDKTSGAAGDYSFADNTDMAAHVVTFSAAMGAPVNALGEADYRYPPPRDRAPLPAPKPPGLGAPPHTTPAHYPNGYAP